MFLYYSLVITYPPTPARPIHKASIHGLWQGFHGNCRVRGTVIVSADKTHSLPKEPLKIGAGCNSSSTPQGIKKESATSPQLFRKPASCGAVAFLDRFSFRTLSELEERSCGHRVDCDRGLARPSGRCGMFSCKSH